MKFLSPNGALLESGFFGKCEHFPRTPHPTVIGHDGFGMYRPNSESSVNVAKDILKKTKKVEDMSNSRAFICKTPIDKELSKAAFSVVSETNTSTTAREDTFAEVKPFLTIESIQPRIGTKNDEETDGFHLPPIVAKDYEINKPLKNRQHGHKLLRFEESVGEEQSLAATDDSGHISYHHRTSRENVPVAGFDEVCKPRSDNSFDFIRPQSRSIISRDGTAVTSDGSYIMERIASGKWCECFDVELNKLLCSECDCVGFHDKKCSVGRSSSRLGLCPNCGKPVRRNRRSYRQSRETSTTQRDNERRRTCSRESMGRRSRSQVRPNMFNQERMYNATDEDYRDVEQIIYNDEGSISQEDEFDEELEMRRQNAKPWPTYDPEIHKAAYCGALGEARGKRMRKIHQDTIEDTLMQQTVTRPFVFSYYRLLPFRRKRDTGLEPLAKPREIEDIRIKNGMKHIFGDVNVDNFYTKSRNSKFLTKKSNKFRSTDIRTQVELTNHSPI